VTSLHPVYTGQPALAGTSSSELEDFVGAKFFCCPHALADGNQCIWIRGEDAGVLLCSVIYTVTVP